ncbi:hypothetical protein ACWM35_12735 [Neobacillus sp. K501]
MSKLKVTINEIIDDVNKEDGKIIGFFEKMTDSMFFLIRWGGIPFVIYLLFTVAKW